MKKGLPLVVRLAIGAGLLAAVGLTSAPRGRHSRDLVRSGRREQLRLPAQLLDREDGPVGGSADGFHALCRGALARRRDDSWRRPADLGFRRHGQGRRGPAAGHPAGRGRSSAGAPKGSPRQQVGDFYASGMDEKRLTDLGVGPLRAEFDRIAAIDNPQALAQALARFQLMTMEAALVGIEVGTDPEDRSRYTIYAGDGDLHMAGTITSIRSLSGSARATSRS